MHTNTFVIALLQEAGCYDQPYVMATFMEGDDMHYTSPLRLVQEAGDTVSCTHPNGWTSVFAEYAGLLHVNNPTYSQGGLFYVLGAGDRTMLASYLRSFA